MRKSVAAEWSFNNRKNEENVVEEWCFSSGKNEEMLLKSGVSAVGK
jgi:hypothetical protein